MTEIWGDLDATLSHVWTLLETGAAPARTLALATVGLRGGGEARMVVLRAAFRGENLLQIHTELNKFVNRSGINRFGSNSIGSGRGGGATSIGNIQLREGLCAEVREP